MPEYNLLNTKTIPRKIKFADWKETGTKLGRSPIGLHSWTREDLLEQDASDCDCHDGIGRDGGNNGIPTAQVLNGVVSALTVSNMDADRKQRKDAKQTRRDSGYEERSPQITLQHTRTENVATPDVLNELSDPDVILPIVKQTKLESKPVLMQTKDEPEDTRETDVAQGEVKGFIDDAGAESEILNSSASSNAPPPGKMIETPSEKVPSPTTSIGLFRTKSSIYETLTKAPQAKPLISQKSNISLPHLHTSNEANYGNSSSWCSRLWRWLWSSSAASY